MFNMYKEKLLRELIAYEEFANMNKTDSDEPFKVKKGVKSGVGYDTGLQRVEIEVIEDVRKKLQHISYYLTILTILSNIREMYHIVS